MAKQILALDIYGTLNSPHGIAESLTSYVGERAMPAAMAWRDKQLEYSFRRGLMRAYEDFGQCTRRALEYVNQSMSLDLDEAARSALLAKYRELPAFADVPDALRHLKRIGLPMFAFSNGLPDDLVALLAHADIDHLLEDIVSVHEIGSFKPDPEVYAHFLRRSGSTAADTWLVSSNPFDVIGARNAGWHAVWVKRDSKMVFDPWDVEPSATISTLAELSAVLSR